MSMIAIITNSFRAYKEIVMINRLNRNDCIYIFSEEKARGLVPSSYFLGYNYFEVKNHRDIINRFKARNVKENTELIDY